MDRDEKWAAIGAQRRVLAGLLETLTDSQCEVPSLCSRWRVKDVAAHVALTPQSPGLLRILGKGLRARGDFDGLNRDMAIGHAARPTATLVAELQDLADDRSKPAITTLDNLVFDTLVHVQDVARPLGLRVEMPLEPARAGLERVWGIGWPFWARRRLRGLTLNATDVDWSVGNGPEVHGPAGDLLLLLTGRTAAALPALSGPGTTRLPAIAH